MTMDDLYLALSHLTGLPRSILDERVGLDLKTLKEFFQQRVLGQPEAVDCLVERVALIKTGLTDSRAPSVCFCSLDRQAPARPKSPRPWLNFFLVLPIA